MSSDLHPPEYQSRRAQKRAAAEAFNAARDAELRREARARAKRPPVLTSEELEAERMARIARSLGGRTA